MSTAALAITGALQLEEALNDLEKNELAQHEATIERGMKTVFDVGHAMTAIRECRLYRGTHKTFEAYCGDRWGFTKTHANRMIAGASVLEDLTPIGAKPKNLEQTKPLARLNPDQRRKAWGMAQGRAAGKDVTAFDLEQAAGEVAPKVTTKVVDRQGDQARYARRKREQERRQKKEQEESDRRQQQRRAEWEKGFHVVTNHFEWLPSRRVYPDLASAISDADGIGQDVAIFQGDRWVASIYIDGENIETVFRDDAEGGGN